MKYNGVLTILPVPVLLGIFSTYAEGFKILKLSIAIFNKRWFVVSFFTRPFSEKSTCTAKAGLATKILSYYCNISQKMLAKRNLPVRELG
jgi:hypothetical protein